MVFKKYEILQREKTVFLIIVFGICLFAMGYVYRGMYYSYQLARFQVAFEKIQPQLDRAEREIEAVSKTLREEISDCSRLEKDNYRLRDELTKIQINQKCKCGQGGQ